ncbi:MAG: hypothetical protein M3261_01605 [Thermoproteota archaeon]|nr:hypothetical protein [Thermoproteota archaeon]
MTHESDAFNKGQSNNDRHRKQHWETELESLGIEPKRQNDLNDKEELEALAEIIKQVYFQDYKTAYEDSAAIVTMSSRYN